jgi:hypothetical protein
MHLACINGIIVRVSKIDRLKEFVIPFFPLVLLVFDEGKYVIIEAHCQEYQSIEFPQLENMVVFVVEPLHEQVVVVFLILIAF